jgi:hypothetical protein
VVGLTHGHVCGATANSVIGWWRGQALGSQAVGQPACRLLLSGHWHHMRAEAAGKDRYWVQCPALESGSDWWRQKQAMILPLESYLCGCDPGKLCPGLISDCIHETTRKTP